MVGFDFASYAAITVICYVFGMWLKTSPRVGDERIPVFVMVFGGFLGVLAFFLVDDFPAGDFLNAFAVGIYSGSFAIGLNQVLKQLGKMQ